MYFLENILMKRKRKVKVMNGFNDQSKVPVRPLLNQQNELQTEV